MPTYEYNCPKCGKKRDVIHGMGETPALECIVCGTPLQRVYTIGAVTFVGGGWGSSNN